MFVVSIAGNVGKDAEMRYTSSGASVLNFSVAVNVSQDDTQWVSCTIWGKLGETMQPMLKKGTKVALTGTLNNSISAEKPYMNLTVQNIRLMSGKQNAVQSEPVEEEDSEGIPF